MIKTKKGISPVIATIIIIAITVAAGVALYGIVQPLVKSNIVKAACTEVTFSLDRFGSCVENKKILHVSIDRTISTDDEPQVVGWRISVSADKGEKRRLDSPSNWIEIKPGEQRTQTLQVPDEVLEEIGGDIVRIDVYPRIRSENVIEDCVNIKRQIRVSSC